MADAPVSIGGYKGLHVSSYLYRVLCEREDRFNIMCDHTHTNLAIWSIDQLNSLPLEPCRERECQQGSKRRGIVRPSMVTDKHKQTETDSKRLMVPAQSSHLSADSHGCLKVGQGGDIPRSWTESFSRRRTWRD